MNLFSDKKINFLWPICLMQFFFSANYYLPIWILFFQSRGMNLTEIGFVSSGVYLASLIFEYPTGIFADKYGRKLSILISLFLATISLIIEVNSHSIAQFFIGAFLMGCAWSFSSGALEAMIYDSLKERKLEKKNSETLGRLDTISSVGSFTAPLVGGLAFSFNNTLPYWLTIISYCFAFIAMMFFKEPKYKKKNEKIEALKNFKKGILLALKNPVLRTLLLLFIPLFFFDEAWYTAKQPFLIQLGLPLVLLGVYEAVRNLAFALGGYFLPKLLNKFKHRTLIACIIILNSLIWFVLGTNNVYSVILFSYMLMLVRQLWVYVDADIIHKHIHSHVRATTLSARQMIISALFVFNPWLMGYLVNSIDRSILYPIFGGVILVVAFVVFFFRRKYF